MPSESDRLLIKRIRQGDKDAWSDLIDLYEGRLMAFAMQRLKNRSDSEDVVQETFIGFLNSLPNFDEKRELQTWLFTIAHYKLTDHLRRLGRRKASVQLVADELLFAQIDPDQRAPSSDARQRERKEIECNSLARILKKMIDSFKKNDGYLKLKVLELLFVKGISNKDVALLLQINEQQVANIRYNSIKKITEQILALGLPADIFPELNS